jgi:hypothetical protein
VTRPSILLTGANGQVGFELKSALALHGEVTAYDRSTLDLGDRDALVGAVRALKPQLIVNAAAYTAVDRAESEPDRAEAINATVPAILAEEAKRIDAALIHFSTDYVFDGAGTTPYDEQVPTRPLNVYGRSKRDGEIAIAALVDAHLIFRTSWVYGLRGGNFLLTMLRLAGERDELRVVADQFGVPNWSRDLAETVERTGFGVGSAEKRFRLRLPAGGLHVDGEPITGAGSSITRLPPEQLLAVSIKSLHIFINEKISSVSLQFRPMGWITAFNVHRVAFGYKKLRPRQVVFR